MSADEMLMGDGRCITCQALPYTNEPQLARLVRWQAMQLDQYQVRLLRGELELAELKERLELVTSERDTAREVAARLNKRLLNKGGRHG